MFPWISGSRLLWLVLGACALFLPFHQLLYSDRALFFRDLSRDLLVQKSIWAEAVRAGEGIPLWNRFALGGTPFYTMIVGSPQHPLNFLFLLFSRDEAPRALAWYLWIHYLAFGAGACLLLRSFRLRWPVAVMMAVSAALSGFLLSAHSLGHLVASAVAVPWYFYFTRTYFRSARPLYLLAASAMIAWPIYAGDPQFTYVLAVISGYQFLRLRLWLPWLGLGALAFLASAAQLLPTAAEIMASERLQIETTELLYFSFHPSRLAELFFPLFFGNRYGVESFWGADLVNFHYKHPFIFSVYLGILSLFSLSLLPLLFRRGKIVRRALPLAALVLAGFFLGMGKFFPLPLYEEFSRWIPLFGLFRYPERFLFWPLFALWLLCSLALERGFRLPKIFLSPVYVFSFASALAVNAAAWWFLEVPGPAKDALFATLWKAGAFLIAAQVLPRMQRSSWLPLVCAVLLVYELWAVQSRLIWFQSKHMADGNRYQLVSSIRGSLASRKAEIESGAAFRLGTEKLGRFEFNAARMDHTVATTFNLFDSLAANTAGFFGIEDVSGYFSFLPSSRLKFWKAMVRPDSGGGDIRFYHDLLGVYYTPVRNPDDQRIRLEVNETALPYLYVPERVLFDDTFDSTLHTLRAGEFRPNRDAALTGLAHEAVEQRGERGNFRILRRDSRALDFEFTPGPGPAKRYLVVSESFHRGWRAWASGVELPLWTANGWSMITELDKLEPGKAVTVEMRFQPPWLWPGLLLTASWWLIVILASFGRLRFLSTLRGTRS